MGPGRRRCRSGGAITARSLLEPIIVRRRGAGYELIAGRHRFEAARNCGHQTIRAEVYDSLSGPVHRRPLEVALKPALARRRPPELAGRVAVLVKDFLLIDLANLFG